MGAGRRIPVLAAAVAVAGATAFAANAQAADSWAIDQQALTTEGSSWTFAEATADSSAVWVAGIQDEHIDRSRLAVARWNGAAWATGTADRRDLVQRLTPHHRGRGYCGSMRVTTWNVNSIKQRVPRFLPWLDQRKPDVVCLQETKLADDAFGALLAVELEARGYAAAVHGEVRWNGVAVLSKVGLDDVVTGLPGAPGFPHQEARAVSATCGGIRVHSVYVPNGREPDSEHYHYKLAWLATLRDVVAAGPSDVLVCGDMNIAPTDADVFDPDAYVGQTHVTPPERAALADLQGVGLHDVMRERWPSEQVFTYWDYRAGMFHKNLGMRIDLTLAGAEVAERVRATWVDRQARKGTGPSDHAPVVVDLDEAPDGDLGPMVPPPSAPAVRRGSRKLPQSR